MIYNPKLTLSLLPSFKLNNSLDAAKEIKIKTMKTELVQQEQLDKSGTMRSH